MYPIIRRRFQGGKKGILGIETGFFAKVMMETGISLYLSYY